MSLHSQEVPVTDNSHSLPPSTPFSSKFLDKDPEATIRRKMYLKTFLGGMVGITIAMLSIFSIYWGALYQIPVHNLSGWIVDFDGGLIGNTVSQALVGPARAVGKLTWTVRSASEFPNGHDDLAQAISDEAIWVIVAINRDATSSLQNATSSVSSSYDGASAITVYGNEARSENGYRALIRPSCEAALQMISKQFAATYIQKIASAPNLQTLATNTPTVLSSPISYTIVNVHPFDVPVATAVTFVGLIFLLLLSFFIVMLGNSARESSNLPNYLTIGSIIRVRMVSVIVAYFIISLVYSALSPAFGLPVNRTFGHAGFVIFWMVNFVGMMSVGFALEAMLTLLTLRFLPFFLLTWVVANVSVCFFPIEVLPGVFKYGYGFPFYNISKAVRTIVFGTHNELGLNFGILIAWTVLSCITIPLFSWISRRRDTKMVQAPEQYSKAQA
ncbi:hypothetical protein DL96DRAFT_1714692 [Flagelloscypha sp. PMI_526]|nr:hypothetical protein DL96DRAFT_1714692 [Flagelloscypha sp. PMI_526]